MCQPTPNVNAEADDRQLDATDAFSVLGNETRMAILRALAEESGYLHADETVSFSELRRRVGIRDAGKFNYHLDQLRGHFVGQSEAGYRLRYAGMVVVSTALSGAFNERADTRQAVSDYGCPTCGRSMMATYEDEFLDLTCSEHDWLFRTALPPGAVQGRSMAEIVELALVDSNQYLAKARQGTCPLCWGEMDVNVPESEDESDGNSVEYECRRCWMSVTAPVVMFLLDHPAVVSFCYDHGLVTSIGDLNGLTLLELDPAATVVSEDPYEMCVDIELGGDRLRFTLDEELAVTAVEDT